MSRRRLSEWFTNHQMPQANSTPPALAEMPMSDGSSPTIPGPSARPKTNGTDPVAKKRSCPIRIAAVWRSLLPAAEP